ncbi:TATA-binding protein-associated phosphoprotein [Entamoeba marina]
MSTSKQQKHQDVIKSSPRGKESNIFFRNKYEYKDFYPFQQAVLLAFLNSYCSITLLKQRKQNTVTSSYPIVKTLHFENEQIDVIQLAETLYRPVYAEDSLDVKKKQTAFRRYEKNKRVFVQHLLIDILTEKGFFFESHLAKNTKKTLRLERIQKIYYNGRIIMDFKDFLQRGNAINTYLSDSLKSTSMFTIPLKDPQLQELILSQNNTLIPFKYLFFNDTLI